MQPIEQICDHHSERSGLFESGPGLEAYGCCKIHADARAVLIWPVAKKDDILPDGLIEKFSQIAFKKEISLDFEELVELVKTVYRREQWVGGPEDNFFGARNKASWCQGQGNVLALLVVKPHAGVDLLCKKTVLRNQIGLEKNSVHISDSHIETLEICMFLLNGAGRPGCECAHIP